MTSVKRIKTIANKWFNENIERFDGAIGAYLSGSLAYMKDNENFPLFSDIDITIVVKDASKFESIQDKEEYKGFIVEWVVSDKSTYNSIDELLLNPYIAQQFLQNNLLLDKDGFLEKCQHEINKRYAQPYYVKKRCKKWFSRLNTELIAYRAGMATQRMAEIIIFANLKHVTVRRLFEVTCEILDTQNRLDLQEYLLESLGSKKFTKSEVIQDLDNLMHAFDFAVMSGNVPHFFGDFNIRACVRPYIYHGTLDMIERKYHRESVWWIFVNYNFAINAILHLPQTRTKNLFIKQYIDFMSRLGYRHNSDNILVKQLSHKTTLQKISLYLQQKEKCLL